MNAPGSHISDQDTNPQPSVSVPFRRVSTLAYHSSPLRDPRDKPSVRQSRWLIVVIPPASLVQDHGPLGHTLTSGPTQRLSQGILMPLQPTMYGQLTAIAREFNFPSPVGLCLYLHVTEQGISMAPRISDDIWPALWGHVFESRSPGPSFQMPICGRVEFDIDRRRALWLNSWLTSDRRHAVDVPVSVPPSLSHHREDSKTTFFDDRGDERLEDLSTLHTTSRSRHIPKKLSLVDRLPFTSSLANAITGSDTADNSLATVLDEEKKPAKIALEKRVESWRASSSVAPTPMAKTSQIPFDPENIPNNLQLSDFDILADTEEEINLNDFAWSATSLGPPDYGSLPSAVSGSHVLSVHLDRRLEGSALLTPSTATSWGPESFDSPPMSIQFRLPSPDIAQRVIEDCPPTPSMATSWGPEELLYSPASVKFRLPSPDLGQRMLEDCPPTPVIGTSWRPEHSRTAISTVSRYPRNLDMSMLSIWPYTPSITTWCLPTTKTSMSGASRTVEPDPSGHVYPYISTTSRPTWTFVWPLYNAENVSNPLPLQFPARRLTWTFIWPLYNAGNASNPLPLQFPARCLTWTFIWPLYKTGNASNPLPLQFPARRLTWSFVWPLYNAENVSNPLPLQFPARRLTWSFVWPLYNAENVSNPLPLQFPARRPTRSFIWPLYKAGNASSPLPSQFPDQNLADEACK
ncbi:hypothetical protein F5888DRAFT_1603530 [Russula emetica]|nr:hypothetical protein F5888DRAFT_1603530 [Russula emetica]